jgi:translation elongation factor EF-Tu-like GTPase
MIVQDVLSIKGRGSVVIGQIENGTITIGDTIRIQGRKSIKTATISGIEVQRKVTTHPSWVGNCGWWYAANVSNRCFKEPTKQMRFKV